MANNYFFYMWRLDLRTLRLLNLANDLGAFLVCFPNYAMLFMPALYSRVTTTLSSTNDGMKDSKQNEVEEEDKEQRVSAFLQNKDISEVFEQMSGRTGQKQMEDDIFSKMQ